MDPVDYDFGMKFGRCLFLLKIRLDWTARVVPKGNGHHGKQVQQNPLKNPRKLHSALYSPSAKITENQDIFCEQICCVENHRALPQKQTFETPVVFGSGPVFGWLVGWLVGYQIKTFHHLLVATLGKHGSKLRLGFLHVFHHRCLSWKKNQQTKFSLRMFWVDSVEIGQEKINQQKQIQEFGHSIKQFHNQRRIMGIYPRNATPLKT